MKEGVNICKRGKEAPTHWEVMCRGTERIGPSHNRWPGSLRDGERRGRRPITLPPPRHPVPGVDAIQTLRRLEMQDAARTLQSMHGRWLSCREASGSSLGTIQKPFSSLRQTLSSFHSLSIHLLNTRSVCTNTLLFPLLPRPLLPSTRSSFHACPCRVLVASMERSRRPWARPISPSYRSPSRFPDLTALSSSLV